ncbi:FOG: Transposon-encoded proteins with TYA, reverse transcriptase, integrase domains in various combinations [Plasmopara halstedii]|uniref:FOG: Transposon-encoded proteins with TYA, reverse transcriptase, integrase domains in various combinations n=1 Tax=Plasmopara halstedii TaxID=4781 RepID=A0A0P1AZP6_PLAHL|nr:FOG: Transposon-encoded proteins with TYA, reverse transcriptase, integrase domains in various combinations [Plasmopara halstedii]CEG47862.1 FOG: Transposon-encoded proteins with TYA, reverse transcriptase, integrase domains in various combinations [Plasmopara halstedii]|eukprot:XP_024584231.1 FOG: Transposon-encoded proteins with TYA, reverse transcriptase, integrase domains in various combinations [Plasmopara halstedii]
MRISRYLSGTRSHKLAGDDEAKELSLWLRSYTEAGFAADKDDRKSVSGAVAQVNDMTESQQCKKQGFVAHRQSRWTVIVQAQSETSSAKAKHVDVKLKFIQDCAKTGVVVPEYVASAEMLANLLTKLLLAPRKKELREKSDSSTSSDPRTPRL